ncbi:pantoate--beta-alanine ligase [Aureibaculum sp. 2210JD6-5]|uniref:pantoate--beta-alanine ligase n=1 Tax=Aureibaculum sp. 2210JD6-5 TaxID=3103957 RepID=UPI002AACFDAF|nr:pantoate--beta-alanine ligase [Aureibaculum sp. 2210JD6-5]MDY7396828.1 pantoate--beta-alanine ligase [Aureibaculum sp. 2210JD6-5]
MKVFYQKETLDTYLNTLNNKISVGFIPTMGALHKGHLSLIERAKAENDVIVVSIFVNPTQFDNKEDLIKYPKDLKKDLEFLENINCDMVFAPKANEIYNDNIEAEPFDFEGLEHEMEGRHRKGHFDGVGTIVKKLFEIVKPDKAYFGEKDFQQLQIVKKLVEKFNLPVKIVPCAIFREEDGLAMSSRNIRLSELHREEAPLIYKILKRAKEKFETDSIGKVIKWVEKQFNRNNILELEYFEIADEATLKSAKHKRKGKNYRAFIAVFVGGVRLIDNIAL